MKRATIWILIPLNQLIAIGLLLKGDLMACIVMTKHGSFTFGS